MSITALRCSQKFGFGACGVHQWRQDLSLGHVPSGDEGLGPMTDILKLPALNFSRLHRQIRMQALQGLNARHFIAAAHTDALLVKCGSLSIEGGDLLQSLLKSGFILDVGMKPVGTAMRLQLGLLLKNWSPLPRKCRSQCPA